MSLCPICQKREAVQNYKPFCSKRCADLDLGQWLDGGYAIPTIDSASSADDDGLDG